MAIGCHNYLQMLIRSPKRQSTVTPTHCYLGGYIFSGQAFQEYRLLCLSRRNKRG